MLFQALNFAVNKYRGKLMLKFKPRIVFGMCLIFFRTFACPKNIPLLLCELSKVVLFIWVAKVWMHIVSQTGHNLF